MVASAPVPEVDRTANDGEAGSDFELVRDAAGFVARAPRRHLRLAVAVFVAVTVTSLAAAFFLPRVYVVDAKILGQRNQVMPSLGNPRRAVPSDADAPTRSARDLILQRENLVAIIHETDLLKRWDQERHLLLRLKDAASALVRGPLTEEQRERALVGVLEKKLQVQADDTTIKLTLEWSKPETGFRIVQAAERRFLEGRKAAEVAVIEDSIDILKTEAANQRAVVDAAFARVVELRHEVGDGPTPPRVTTVGSPAPAKPRTEVITVPAPPPPEEREISARLDVKRRAIRAVEDPWRQRLVQLEAELSRLRMTYAEAHPAVIQAEADLRAARAEPAELSRLRQEEHDLVAQLPYLGGGGERRVVRAVPAPKSEGGSGAAVVVEASHEDEPELATAKTRLTAATHKYEDLMDRGDAARIELLTAQAAFKYRYTIVGPPEVPREAKRPNRALLVIGGMALGLVLAFFVAAARDVAGGRFIEAWQVRRRLRIPVLAEIEAP